MSLQKIINGAAAVVLGAYFAVGYSSPKKLGPEFITGRVISENFQKRFMGEDRYTFSLSTSDSSIRVIHCNGDYSAPQMDAVISPGSNLKLKLNNGQSYYLCKEDVIEIDGIKTNFSR